MVSLDRNHIVKAHDAEPPLIELENRAARPNVLMIWLWRLQRYIVLMFPDCEYNPNVGTAFPFIKLNPVIYFMFENKCGTAKPSRIFSFPTVRQGIAAFFILLFR